MGRETDAGYERWLNGATALLLVVAAALLVRDRVLPAWRALQVTEVGEQVPGKLSLAALASGDTLTLDRLAPSLLLFFQSTCPACTRNLPAWRRLLAERPEGLRPVAVGLERTETALAYAREELPGSLAVRPVDRSRTLRLLDVEAVPTTQLVGADGRLLWSRSGVLTAEDVARLLARSRGEAGPPEPAAAPPSPSSNGSEP